MRRIRFQSVFTKARILRGSLILLCLIVVGLWFNHLGKHARYQYHIETAVVFADQHPDALFLAKVNDFDDLVSLTHQKGYQHIRWERSLPSHLLSQKIPKLIVTKPVNVIPFVTIQGVAYSKVWWSADLNFVFFFNFFGSAIPMYTYPTHWSDDQ